MVSVSGTAALEARGLVNGVLCSQGTHIEHVVTYKPSALVQGAGCRVQGAGVRGKG